MRSFKGFIVLLSLLSFASISFAQIDEVVEESDDVVVDDVLDLGESNVGEINDLINVTGENSVDLNNKILDEEIYSLDQDEKSDLDNQDEKPSLSDLSIGFCNDGVENASYTLNAALTVGNPFTVCLLIVNNGNKDIKANLDFSETVLDNLGGLACGGGEDFRQFVVNADEISEFVVPAQNYVVKEAKVLYPVGVEKNQGGCFAVWMDPDENLGGGDGFSVPIISRIGAIAKFYVGDLGNIKNELKVLNKQTRISENGELILTFDVNNLGNLENKISIDGIISNIFGFKKTYNSEQFGLDANVLPGSTKSVEVNMGLIPNYGGLFNIEFNVTGTPYFSYKVSDDFDKSLLEPLTYAEKTTYFKMPWLICIIVVIVIILLIVLFRRPKPQVVYVQTPQQPQQPQPQYQQPQYQNPQYQQPVNNQVPQQPQYQQPQQPMQQ